MPANRSRTQRWRDVLDQIAQRGGAIELSVAPPELGKGDEITPSDLIWRVRLAEVSDQALIVECPSAAGLSLSIDEGIPLVGAMTIGQNRWMFHTSVAGTKRMGGRPYLVLTEPQRVERCPRRAFNRISRFDEALECYERALKTQSQ